MEESLKFLEESVRELASQYRALLQERDEMKDKIQELEGVVTDTMEKVGQLLRHLPK